MLVIYNHLRGKWWEKQLYNRPTGKTLIGMKDTSWGAERGEMESSQASGSSKGEAMIWGGQRQQCVSVRKGHLFNIPAARWKNASGDFSEQWSQMQEHLKGGLFESATDRYDESIFSGQKISHPLILPFPSPLLHFSKQISLFSRVSLPLAFKQACSKHSKSVWGDTSSQSESRRLHFLCSTLPEPCFLCTFVAANPLKYSVTEKAYFLY